MTTATEVVGPPWAIRGSTSALPPVAKDAEQPLSGFGIDRFFWKRTERAYGLPHLLELQTGGACSVRACSRRGNSPSVDQQPALVVPWYAGHPSWPRIPLSTRGSPSWTIR